MNERENGEMESGRAIVDVRSLTKVYRGRKGPLTALKDLSFQGRRGEVLGILGPNGSGKTTTIKSIATLIEFDAGEVSVMGVDVKKQPRKARSYLGAVLEGARNVYWRLTPWENLLYFAGLRGLTPGEIRERARGLLDSLGLSEVSHKQVRFFSKGMQQKVAVACAFITKPPVVLLDEPTLGLDVETARKMRSWILETAKEEGTFVLITSHDMRFIESVCHRVLILKEGRVLREGTPESLRNLFSRKVYRIVLEEDPQEWLLAHLQPFPGFRIERDERGGSLLFSLQDPSELYRVFALLQSASLTLRSLDILNDDFEEVFLDILKDGDALESTTARGEG